MTALATGGSGVANAGAVCGLVGSLLDDVPEQWVQKRSREKYTRLLGLIQANSPFLNHPNALQAGLNLDVSTSVFVRETHSLEIARVEHLTSTLKAIFSSVAFGFSAKTAAVGAAGGVSIVLGPLIGVVLSNCLLSQPEPPPVNPNNVHIPEEPSYTNAGDYKGLIAVLKFYGGVTAAVGCAVGLAISKIYLDDKSFSHYADNNFFAAAANAVAAGAALGSALATSRYRVAATVDAQCQSLARSFVALRPANHDQAYPHQPIPVLNTIYRAGERLFMGIKS